MTIIVFFAVVVVSCIFEELFDCRNFNLEKQIRKMQDKSRLFS